jgi:hypothetical protein
MADNTTLPAGSGGDVVATDDVTTLNGGASSGVKVQRVKVMFGDDNTARDASDAFPMPVRKSDEIGRVYRHFMLDTYTAAPVADALQNVVQWYNNAAVAATTTPAVVPAGKRLRLQSYYLETKSLATVGSVVVRVRVNTAGVAAIGSPLVFTFGCGSRAGATTVAMTGGSNEIQGNFPQGFEIPAGAGIGFSLAGYGPTGVLTLQGVTRFAVYGYEY